jgi:hypothetical protein
VTTDAAAVAAVDTATTPAGTDAPVVNMGDLKRAVEQREALKARNKELEAAAAELKTLKEAQMTEAQKSAARVAELEPLAQRTTALEASVNALLEQELTTVPEELRDMVPPLDVVDKLNWLRQAKAKGLFAAPAAAAQPTNAPLPRRPAAVGGNTITKSVLANMAIGPQRTATMNAIRENKIAVIDG